MGLSLLEGFAKSLAMTILSEIGDNTFFAAAILAMRHPRGHVLAGCLVSLIITTLLSAALGYVAPNLVPRKWTHHITTLLFFVFGIWSLWEGFTEDGDDDELAEVEAKINADSKGKSKNRENSKVNIYQMKRLLYLNQSISFVPKNDFPAKMIQKELKLLYLGRARNTAHDQDNDDLKKSKRPFMTHFFSPIFIKAFSITFFGEWGDRSQIATIGLAADENPFGVVLGGILGQALCTILAVVGGKGLASHISEKIVTLASGALFIGFGVHSFLYSGDD